MASLGSFQLAYFVDEEGKFITSDCIGQCLAGLDDVRSGAKEAEKLVLISGPDGFIEYWAGRKVWIGGQEAQGPLGGVLGQMKLGDWKVWKL
jgi:hypothetical protein